MLVSEAVADVHWYLFLRAGQLTELSSEPLCSMNAVAYLASALLRPVNVYSAISDCFTSSKSRTAGKVIRCDSTSTMSFSRSQAAERSNMRSISAWPKHQIVQVNSRSTEVYQMSSTGGFGLV